MQTLQQQRAKHALEKVKAWVPLNDGDKLKARASELPFMIHANGLGPALAFFKSKKDKDGYDKLYLVLQSWLTQPARPFAGKPDLMAAITETDFNTYRLAQAEAIVYMDWVKKFSSAYL
jgi:CRISPR-associated protein Cmr5